MKRTVQIALLLASVATGATPASGDGDPPAAKAPPTPDDLSRAQAAGGKAIELYQEGNYEAALTALEEARGILERRAQPDDETLGGVCSDMGVVLHRLGRYVEAAHAHEQALRIRQHVFGPSHALVARSLNNLGNTLQALDRYEESETLSRRALAMREKELGEDDPAVAESLNNLASLLAATGRVPDAIPLIERVAAIYEKTPGPESVEMAQTQGNLGYLLMASGRTAEARPHVQRALALHEKLLPPEHPMLATPLGNWAMVLRAEGRYEAALPFAERSLAIDVKADGAESPQVAFALNNLASILEHMGRYEEARERYERSVAIYRKTLGPDHTKLALVLGNLGTFLSNRGSPAEARPLLQRALEILEKALGPEHEDVAVPLVNLADDLREQGEMGAAEPLFVRAIHILEKAFGPDHPDLSAPLDDLGLMQLDLGRLAEARANIERALRIDMRAHGADHPRIVSTLENLASIHEAEGRFDLEGPLRERALEILEKHLGKGHADTLRTRNNLAVFLDEHGDRSRARDLMRGNLEVLEDTLRRSLGGAAGPERLGLVHSMRLYLDNWVLRTNGESDAGYRDILRFKGLVTRLEASERRLERRDQTARERLAELRAAQRRASALLHESAIGEEARAAWRRTYSAAVAEAQERFRVLSRDFAPLREGLSRLDLTTESVRGRLPTGTALVDFLRANERYLAWILASSGKVHLVDLGPAAPIDEAARRLTIGSASVAAREEDPAVAGRALRESVLRPIEAVLPEGTRALVLCCDAALAAVPFASLPGKAPGSYLADEYALSHVSMAQDLVPWGDAPVTGKGFLLLGDIDYESAKAGDVPGVGAPASASGSEPRPAGDRAPRGLHFDPLAGTAAEIDDLGAALGADARVLRRADASEARLRAAARGRRGLHFATHGFVREDRLPRLQAQRAGSGSMRPDMERHLAAADPRYLAGLALAGANRRAGGGVDDGILTAFEVSLLDLDACDLVVLSACDTARGTVESGEGVLGLVSAFQLAGARDVIASLWAVDDDATRLLMSKFYELWLSPKESRSPPIALREAARWLRDTKPGGKDYSAPRYWAAFVCYERR